jgi:hypothetical protein
VLYHQRECRILVLGGETSVGLPWLCVLLSLIDPGSHLLTCQAASGSQSVYNCWIIVGVSGKPLITLVYRLTGESPSFSLVLLASRPAASRPLQLSLSKRLELCLLANA